MRHLLQIWGVILLISSSLHLYAAPFVLDIGQELTQGQTDYNIGISLLEFPVDNTLFPYINGRIELSDRISIAANVSSGRKIDQSKKFLDSDYSIPNDPSTLFIYSESDNDLKMTHFSFDLSYILYSKSTFDLLIGGGIKQHQFDYKVYNVHQWLVNVPGSDQYINDITALTYQSTETIPYLSVGLRQRWSKLSLYIEGQYSNMVSYEGSDDHVLRSKYIDFSGTGDFYSFSIQTTYFVNSNWSLSMGYQVLASSTYGNHTQTRYKATSEGAAGVIGIGTQTTDTTLSSIKGSLSYQF